MTKPGIVAASVAAASAAVISASASVKMQFPQVQIDDDNLAKKESLSADKYTPRFDGLRFIETLVTAHR